jgi:hypothetical protein
MPTPQLPGFGDASAFIRRFKDIDHRINLLFEKLNNVLANTGLSVPSPGVTQVDGSLNVVGNLNVSGSSTVSGSNGIQSSNYVASTSGWKFNGTSLEANTGVIGNGALANPVSPGQAFQGASTFALSVAGSNIITITRTVPSGYTSVVVTAFGRVAATNSTAAKDALYSSVDVNGTGGNQFGNEVLAGDFGSVSAGYSTLLTGLSAGASVATHLYASTGLAAWASSGSNGADLSVTYLWFR